MIKKNPNQINKNPNKLANKMKLNRREKEKAKMKKKKIYFENMNQFLESLEFVLALLNYY